MAEVQTPAPKKRKKGCLIAAAVLGALFLGAGAFYGPAILDFYKVYGPDILSKPERHKYAATSEQNLKAIYQGMMLYHESEGQFPLAEGWMDAIANRLKSNDLEKGEAEKKLIRPDLAGTSGAFGYAMNESTSGKYKDDVADPGTTPLIYESKQTARNAKGDARDDRDGLAISVSGAILKGSE